MKNVGNATTRKRRVVLVDEDKIQMCPFVMELELRGIEVRRFFEADACLRSSRLLKSVGVFLVDVMLVSERRYAADETLGHLYTGVFLARDLRKYHQTAPIVLISNHSIKDSVTRIRKALVSIGNCAFVPKQSFKSALDFGNTIEAVMSYGVGALKKGLWKRVGAGILVQPNFAGVGVDLREVFGIEPSH